MNNPRITMISHKIFICLSLIACFITTHAATNSGSNLTPIIANTTLNTPTINSYYGSNGKYAGTSQSVNGGTSYYKNGQYQGQATTGSNIYYNQSGQMQIISSPPLPINTK